jgi:O-antigen ligase
LASYGGHGPKRYLYAAVAVLLCVALVLANSRGGIISMLGQFAFLSWVYLSWVLAGRSREQVHGIRRNGRPLWLSSRMRVLRCLLILLLLGVALSGVLWLGGEPVRRRLESVPSEFQVRTSDVEEGSPRRLQIWASTLKLIEAHPLLGSGLGAYETAITRYWSASNEWQPQQAHNEYLELGAGGGLFGGVLGIWFVLILMEKTSRRLHDTDSLGRAICLGALVGLVGVAIHSFVDFGLHVMVNALICCALVTLATAKIRCAAAT